MLSRRGFLGLSLGAVAGMIGAGLAERAVTQQYEVVEYQITVRAIRVVGAVGVDPAELTDIETSFEPQTWSFTASDRKVAKVLLNFSKG